MVSVVSKRSRILGVVYLFLSVFVSVFPAEAKIEIDRYLSKGFDLSSIKSVYIMAPEFMGEMPENMELSLGESFLDWLEQAIESPKNKHSFVIKSTAKAWRDIQLIFGPLPYEKPNESKESYAFFLSKLPAICSHIIKTEFHLSAKKHWHEERTETVTEYDRAKVYEKRSDGRTAETYVTIPVVRTKRYPGFWSETADAWTRVKIFDSKNMDDRYIAAVRAANRDDSNLFHEVKPARVLKSTVEAAVSNLFYGK